MNENNRRTARRIAAIALTLACSPAFALGLGAIVVKSRLDEPLVAEIPVIGASPEEASGLQARLGSPADLERSGIDAARGSSAVELDVVQGKDGRTLIRVTTRNAVHDPMLSFLVNLSWSSGRLVREYRVSLPPSGGAPSTVTQAAPEPERAVSTPPPAEPRPNPKPKPMAAEPAKPAAPKAPVAETTPAPPAKAPVAENRSSPQPKAPAESKVVPPARPLPEAKATPAPPKTAPAPATTVASRSDAAPPPKVEAPPPPPTRPAVQEPKPAAPAAKPEGSVSKAAASADTTAKPAASAEPAPKSAGATQVTDAQAELDRAKSELASKESDTRALRARVEELEKSQPANRQRLEDENRKLAEAERQLSAMADEARAQQEALAQLQARTATPAPPAPAGADTGAQPPAPAASATGTTTTEPVPAASSDSGAPAAGAGPEADDRTPAPRPERTLLDEWLIPAGLGVAVLIVGAFVLMRSRRGGIAAPAPAPVLATAGDEPEFDLSEPGDTGEAAAVGAESTVSATSAEAESQFDMLRLFYLRGDAPGFEDTARFLKEHDPDPELWRRVAEMGRMLEPENPLYAESGAAHMEFDLPDLQPPAPAESMVEAESSLHEHLFESEPVAPRAAAGAGEFAQADELAPFEMEPAPPAHEAATIAMPALAPMPEAPATQPEPPRESAETARPPDAGTPTPPPPPAEPAPPAGANQDPVDTKLELAQAYLEMGDPEAARQMLDEVMDEGDSRQRAEATRLRAEAGPGQRRA